MTRLTLVAAAAVLLSNCSAPGSAASSDGAVTPVYSKDTGKLEELQSDRNGDGKVDTRAFMDGVRVLRVEIDRDGDGRTDRWEYYGSATDATVPQIERADESEGSDGRIVRREFYEAGVISRVEEDTDHDDRPDKWEHYVRGTLLRVELDFQGLGKPSQRLIYGRGGAVERVESDPDGDGVFVPVRPDTVTPPATPTQR
jgi:hypothetical protein